MSSNFVANVSEFKRWRMYLMRVAQQYYDHQNFISLMYVLIALYEYSVAFLANEYKKPFKASAFNALPCLNQDFIIMFTRVRNAAVHRPTGPYNLYTMCKTLLFYKEDFITLINETIEIDDSLCNSYISVCIDMTYKMFGYKEG